MTTKLSQFIGNVKDGMAKTTHYDVFLSRPNIVPASLYGNTELNRIMLFCEQATLPGLTIATSPIRTYGEVREMPYEKMFDNITLTFYVDKEMKVKYFFDEWISNIQNPTSRTFNYYDDYTTDIEIVVYDIAQNTRYRVKLFEAYPKTVSPVALDYNGKEVMRVQVTLNYRYWKSSLMTSDNYSGLAVPTGLAGLLTNGLAIPNQFWNNYVNFQQTFDNAASGLSEWWNSL